MSPTRRAVVAARIQATFLFGPCEAENAIFKWLGNVLNDKTGLQTRASTPDKNEPLKVFSAEMSHTGTMSLQAALNELGYNTWHGEKLDREYVESITQAYKTGDSSDFLDNLAREGYNASAEFMYFPVLTDALARYPEARVILSVRDSSEKWVSSQLESWRVGYHMAHGPLFPFLEMVSDLTLKNIVTLSCANFPWMVGAASTSVADVMAECVDYEAVQKSSYWRAFFHDRDLPETRVKLNKAYHKLIADVRRAVPQEKLLEFDVKQGYGPLCRFLDIAEDSCPATFPKVNAAGEMVTAGYIFAAIRFGWWVPILMFFLCVSRCCCRPRKVQKND